MPVVLGLKSIEHTPYISSSFTPPRHQHSHEFFEVSFCVTGQSINTVNGVPVPFQNGTCMILRPQDVHSVTGYNRNYEHVDLYVTKEHFYELCQALHEGLYQKILAETEPLHLVCSNEIFSFLFNQSFTLDREDPE